MDIRFNASGRMVWDVATAVAWRLDPDRPALLDPPDDPSAREAVERVYIDHVDTVETPPRLRRQLMALEVRFPGARSEIMGFVLAEHVFAALRSDVTVDVQSPDRAPFLLIGEQVVEDAILVDIDIMLREYREATQRMEFSREQEEVIKKVIRNSITPRFDRVEVRLEELSHKLDSNHQAVSDKLDGMHDETGGRFEEVLKELRKLSPPQP